MSRFRGLPRGADDQDVTSKPDQRGSRRSHSAPADRPTGGRRPSEPVLQQS